MCLKLGPQRETQLCDLQADQSHKGLGCRQKEAWGGGWGGGAAENILEGGEVTGKKAVGGSLCWRGQGLRGFGGVLIVSSWWDLKMGVC